MVKPKPKTDEASAAKRTLKEIYQILKKEVIPKQGEGSSDSEGRDDSGDSCLEDDDNAKRDDGLTPAELEELQKSIINAIESFEKLYKPKRA